MTVVVAALAGGAAAGTSNVVSTAVMDAYKSLKALVLGRLRSRGLAEDQVQDLVALAAGGEAGRIMLAEELARVGVDDSMLEAANRLLGLLDPQKTKYVVDASQAKGLVVGDFGTQHNTFD